MLVFSNLLDKAWTRFTFNIWALQNPPSPNERLSNGYRYADIKASADASHKTLSNESTTPALKARGPRRAALGSGPLGAWPYVLPSFGSGSVTPDVRYRELTEREMGR